MSCTRPVLVLLAAQLTLASNASAGDAARGEKVFARCRACHSIEAGGKNQLGPNLHGVVGRTAGTVARFPYSKALFASGVTWTEDKLDAFLADPKATLPGNKMAFVGLKQASDRADVIAYMREAK